MHRFVGKVAVVTGASRGIGLATAHRLAGEGAHVVLVARDDVALESARKEIEQAGGKASAVPADVTRPADLDAVRDHAWSHAGAVDVLAAFAGGGGDPVAIGELSPQRWNEVIDTNLTSTFLTVACFLPAMMDRASGSVLTMSSTAGRGPTQASPAYAAAKAGVIAFTRQAALQAAARRVRVNAVAPGSVRTDRMAAMPADIQANVAALHPLGRLGTGEDIAAAAAFLLSDEASWITGVTLDIAGGRVMS